MSRRKAAADWQRPEFWQQVEREITAARPCEIEAFLEPGPLAPHPVPAFERALLARLRSEWASLRRERAGPTGARAARDTGWT